MRILFAITALLLSLSASAQETKKILLVHVTMNNQHPDKFVLEDDYVKITYKNFQLQEIDFNIHNKTDKSLEFVWSDSYFVINGQSERADNFGVSKVGYGAFGTATVDNLKDQRIAPNFAYLAKMGTDKLPFNDIQAKKNYRSTGETLVNRAVIALRINGELKEYPISIELYTKDELKNLKGE